MNTASIEADLLRYVGYGEKRAGGPGDTACGEWLAGELAGLGYAVERQTFSAPFFDAQQADLEMGDVRTPLYPQPIVSPTGPEGVTGPLVRMDSAGRFAGSLDGAIAVVDLAHARWSSLLSPGARDPIRRAFAMERREARLTIQGDGGRRSAFNFVGRMERGKGRWLAISTPRSGWFVCAAERGPGVAVWLDLARWARDALPDYDLAFICNTGHEYEYLGAAEAMKEIAPPPAATRFWLHLGANVAARDWHEAPGKPSPLPSVDSQRFLSISPDLLPLAREVFAGQAGYEAPVSSQVLAAGELVEVIKAGYSPAAGVFGIHRYHHVAEDDARCLNLEATVAAAEGFRRLVSQVAAASA